jgi:hypothetical protein
VQLVASPVGRLLCEFGVVFEDSLYVGNGKGEFAIGALDRRHVGERGVGLNHDGESI